MKYALNWANAANFPKAHADVYAAVKAAAANYATTSQQSRVQIDTNFDASVAKAGGSKGAISGAVRTHERAYRQTGKDLGKLIVRMRAAVTKPGCTLTVKNEAAINQIFLSVAAPQSTQVGSLAAAAPKAEHHLICKAMTGATRFFQVTAANDMAHDFLLCHGESRVQYIVDRNNKIVRRFVKRAMNEHDYRHLNSREDMRSQLVPGSGTAKDVTHKEISNFPGMHLKTGKGHLTEQRKALFHLQKGSGRFVSASTTKHQVFSNSGEEFEDKSCGYIIIVLAYVPRETIMDVHTEGAITGAIGLKRNEFDGAFASKGRPTVNQRAARDVCAPAKC